MRKTAPRKRVSRVTAPPRPMRRFAPASAPPHPRCHQLALRPELYRGVLDGRIVQIRTSYTKGVPSFETLPQPLIVWTPHPVIDEAYSSRLYTLTENRVGQLHDATDGDVLREGFESRTAWRRWWMAQTGDLFDPLLETEIYRIREYHPADASSFGRNMIEALLGDLMDGKEHDTVVRRRPS